MNTQLLFLFVSTLTIGALAHNCNRERTTSTSTTAPSETPSTSTTTSTTSTTTVAPTRAPTKAPELPRRRPDIEREDGPSASPDFNHDKVVVCYYGSWAVYRPGRGKYPVENIDPFLCTHIIYGFTGLGHDNRMRALDPWNDLYDNYGKGAFERFTGLKKLNPKLKTLIAIGGWNEGSVKYSNMVANPSARDTFVSSVVDFLGKYNFDGLDMDWEYPAARGGKPEDKANYVSLLRELKSAFTPNGYLLTAAVSAGKWFVEPAYDVPEVARYLDLINVMAYDYHGGWEDKTGHNAPMYARPDEVGNDRISNVNFSINFWIAQGAPREKIILGMGTYGRSFTLARESVNGYYAPAPQKGQAGPYTREGGSLGYNEICEMMQKQTWTVVRDPYHLAPYAYSGRQWVGYDDVESIAVKTRYINSMGLGGGMIWSLETDDFQGDCGGEKYPLLKTINRVLSEKNSELPTPMPAPASTEEPEGEDEDDDKPSSSTHSWERAHTSSSTTWPSWTPGSSTSTTTWPSWSPDSSTSSTTTTSTTTTTTASPPSTSSTTMSPGSGNEDRNWNGALPCKQEGMHRHPKDCKKFYRCVNSGVEGRYMVYEYDCPSDTVFDTATNLCLWPQSVPECSNYYSKDRPNEIMNHKSVIDP